MLTRVRNTVIAGAAVFALTACEERVVTPQEQPLTIADMHGTYMATEAGWTAAADAGTHFDLVGTGGTYEMVILPDGAFTTRIHREGHADTVDTGIMQLTPAGDLTVTQNGVTRPIDFTWQDGTLTWADSGTHWDFGAGAGMEDAHFRGTFARQ
jgi:hypothetical protein